MGVRHILRYQIGWEGDTVDRQAEHGTSKRNASEDGFLKMVAFQLALCLLAVFPFLGAMQTQGEDAETARDAAALLCGVQSEETLWELAERIGSAVQSFWQGGAARLLEELADWIGRQVVPPEQLPQLGIGESGTGGPLPTGATGVTLAPYRLTARMCSPVSGPVTSAFGWRTHPLSQQEDFHKGVDIAAAMGTPVLAALPGVVEQTGFSESYGNFVVMRHSERLRTTYNHCSKILAQEGERLAQGDRIALVGSTGISTGPHLHFEVEVEGLKADPLQSLPTRRVTP